MDFKGVIAMSTRIPVFLAHTVDPWFFSTFGLKMEAQAKDQARIGKGRSLRGLKTVTYIKFGCHHHPKVSLNLTNGQTVVRG